MASSAFSVRRSGRCSTPLGSGQGTPVEGETHPQRARPRPAKCGSVRIVADIEATTIAPEAANTQAAPPGRARRVVAIVLVVCVGLLSVLSVVAGYVRGELLDTDSYVEMVAPLARNPAVQAEVVDAVTDKVVDSVRLDDLTESAIELLRARDGRLAQLLNSDRRLADALNSALSGVGPMLQNQLEAATRRAAERVVESPQFAELWAEANRVAQSATLAALRDEGSALRTDDGAVRIDIGVVVEVVKQRLIQSGFALAERIPAVDSEIVLIETAQLAQAQQFLLIFDQIAPWVPWVTLALAIAAVLVAPVRRRGLLWVGAAVAAAMIILTLTLVAVRHWLLTRVATTSVEPAAAAAILDAALDPLRSRVWVVLVVALLIVIGAVLAGPAGSRLRARIQRLRQKNQPEVH